ncbi:MAG: thioredoxin family protein [candidate division WOR-3 bacterium]|nr:thioredoxin family protein [candidate division WOR-3 bacterium]MDH5683698.1 thioredoxin family protein [candidate division WOR-3 bacterium]
MPLISDENKKQIQEIFQKLTNKVIIHFFTQEFECESCKAAHELLQELTALSDKLELKVYDFLKDQESAKKFEIDKIPAIVLEGQKVYGIRFFGIPSGYEFAALLEDLVDVSKGITELSLETISQLNTLIKHLHIQVFTTPTCPYCPIMVRMAHKLALMSERIKADMVASIEFPHLASKYSVLGVPKTIVNDGAVEIDGVLPEPAFVQQVMRAA